MSFWDNRFSNDEYIYGEFPNAQFVNFIDGLSKGKILFPGEGEGRNAVYAAKKGWEVVAIDQSSKGKEKAMELALRNKVNIQYKVGDIMDSGLQEESFDAIVLVFLHLPSDIRKIIHCYLQTLLKPKGKLLLVGFSKEQLKFSSGGPKSLDMLYTCEMLKEDFSELKLEKNVQDIVELKEGLGHEGKGSIIIMQGEKKY